VKDGLVSWFDDVATMGVSSIFEALIAA